ncbi:MAG TPA: ATP synthase F1 subunit gamma [Acidimicrobiales bacterium]|nr:ATP synthase F1 subunit gamma [Acidimicrobiales bacterium]
MPGGQERVLRRRIKSVQSTKKITRAMELIASSQIVRSQNRIRAAAPYQRGIAQVLADAALDAGDTAGRVTGVPEAPERIVVLALVADRGLCGGYNANVLRRVERLVRAGRAQGQDYAIVAVGKKALSYLRFRGIEVTDAFTGFSDRPTFEDARRVAAIVTPQFVDESVDQVFIVSTRFLSAGTQVVETRQLLPLPEPGGAAMADDGDAVQVAGPAAPDVPAATTATGEHPAAVGYTEFEPESADLLVELVPRYVEAALFGALLEAAASEHTARQRAMAAATDNADELVKTLTRVMNRARQDAITTEIMEIVGGAEALRQSAKAED